jgi:hypothetical protein
VTTFVLDPDEPTFVHFFAPMTIPSPGHESRLVTWGDEMEVTSALITYSADRNGDSWLALLDDHDGQRAKWGEVRFARGHWPESVPKLEPGSVEEADAIAEAYRLAWALTDEAKRKEVLGALRARYGGPPLMNNTHEHYGPKE